MLLLSQFKFYQTLILKRRLDAKKRCEIRTLVYKDHNRHWKTEASQRFVVSSILDAVLLPGDGDDVPDPVLAEGPLAPVLVLPEAQLREGAVGARHLQHHVAVLHVEWVPAQLVVTQEPLVVEPLEEQRIVLAVKIFNSLNFRRR